MGAPITAKVTDRFVTPSPRGWACLERQAHPRGKGVTKRQIVQCVQPLYN
eukprot:COSAG06_NODE_43201_length_374_cov_0.818182_1_plen_49_part_01